ncbi:UNVERIFIED_CONTAM: hypothetical protein GTU68_020274, partial [Idotea baltica]|nr:hypothetical protein [Idotea baltica]
VVEISCHGSQYIIQKILELFLSTGARAANPGEFTLRAFLNGQLDLSQAEAVADLIASKSESQHKIAMDQMRGGVSVMIKGLRSQLIEFASLIELENDFGEEDVEFADRNGLKVLVQKILTVIIELQNSFKYGNAVKEGVPVAIIGAPNVGKSTLLNTLLNEDRAIVSDIAGTTRDVIEDSMQIDGILFRFVDTAGLRETTDHIESIGIEKTKEQTAKAKIVLFVVEIEEKIPLQADQQSIIILNKADSFHTCHSYDVEEAVSTLTNRTPTLAISAKEKTNVEKIKKQLVEFVHSGKSNSGSTILSNTRHYAALEQTKKSLEQVITGLDSQTPSDLIAMDIRHALHYLGEISGEISTDDLLESIFSYVSACVKLSPYNCSNPKI